MEMCLANQCQLQDQYVGDYTQTIYTTLIQGARSPISHPNFLLHLSPSHPVRASLHLPLLSNRDVSSSDQYQLQDQYVGDYTQTIHTTPYPLPMDPPYPSWTTLHLPHFTPHSLHLLDKSTLYWPHLPSHSVMCLADQCQLQDQYVGDYTQTIQTCVEQGARSPISHPMQLPPAPFPFPPSESLTSPPSPQ